MILLLFIRKYSSPIHLLKEAGDTTADTARQARFARPKCQSTSALPGPLCETNREKWGTMKQKRIERATSGTAQMTCVSRTASFFENRSQYKTDDFIAPRLVPKKMLPFLKIGFLRKLCIPLFTPTGIYEYVIARTKYMDSIFKKAVSDNFDQILIFGAGFDSRGIRFSNARSHTGIFELDVPVTQNAKIQQLEKRKIEIPSNIVFVSIDFAKENLEEKLSGAGFLRNKRSLFILEGLIMYLSEKVVRSTFQIIQRYSAENSEVVFDYIYASVCREENQLYGEKEIFNTVKKAGEGWSFGIENGEIENFLKKYDFRLVEHLNSRNLEERYFRSDTGNIVGKINGTHCIAHAIK